MNLREPFASTAVAGLGWSEISERPIDRVAASGFADALGVRLWKAKYQDSSTDAVSAVNTLADKVKQRYKAENKDTCYRIAFQCLIEYLKPHCLLCMGRGETKLQNGVKIICRECRGTQVKRYTDFDRARSMQISLAKTRAITHKLSWLSDEIQRLDMGVNRVMNEQLERLTAA